MSAEPSRAVKLVGTEEAVAPPKVLQAGPLSAELESGNLRYVRFGGVELIRAISFIVRDRNWGTYNPVIDNLAIEETGDRFRVTYDAETGDGEQTFSYSAFIEGQADGRLSFSAVGHATTDFLTNRTGFVVLHPGEHVAGRPVTIEHVDGKREEGAFPTVIDPLQPMMDLRALTHEAAPGLKVTCRMEGDTYEMEDQRNWTDASFKTYVRPLALPWPYTLEKGATLEQAVRLTVEGNAAGASAAGETVRVSLGAGAGSVPPLGVGLDPADAEVALAHAGTLRLLGIAHLVCHHDPRRGHDRIMLEKSIAVARELGATPWLEAVIAELDDFEVEIAALGETVRGLGSPFETVLVSPAPDLKCTLPGSPWPPCPPLADVYRAARKAFPGARLGGGMFSYFTELNRKRPPTHLIDLVSFTTSAMVHAGDDRSVMEGLGSLPFIAESVAQIAGDRPFAVGPSAIGMRDNPYGDQPMANPGNIRQAMNFNDPRQRGLLGAAWNLGYFVHFADGGATAVTLGGLVGPFGVLHAPTDWPAPWFERHRGLYPVFHVVKGLAALAGRPRRSVSVSAPQRVQAVAAEGEGGLEIWLANLTDSALDIAIEGATLDTATRLDDQTFTKAAGDGALMDAAGEAIRGDSVSIAPYGVVRLRMR